MQKHKRLQRVNDGDELVVMLYKIPLDKVRDLKTLIVKKERGKFD
ncbi:hypothetical protein [Moheibacter sediminis]|nr:hypothetical protein [Moheibacter sediminis]